MTKSELILKFARNERITDADAKVFFDILLKRISDILGTGQSVAVREFGYFHRIKGKIRKTDSGHNSGEISEEFIDLLLYSEGKKLGQSDNKGFVFSIPSAVEENYNPVDSYFSLGIGKPVIPLRGNIFHDEYLPTGGYEYRIFLETKIEKIIKESQISFSDEEFPTLVIDATSYSTSEIQLDKDEKDLAEILSDDQDKTESPDLKRIAWDFGEYFSEKISAESIIDLTAEKINASEQANQAAKISDLNPDEAEETESVLDELLRSEDESDVKGTEGDQELQIPEGIPEPVSGITKDKQFPEFFSDFEEVKFAGAENKPADEDLSDDDFWKSTSKLFETYDPKEVRQENGTVFTEVRPTAVNIDDQSAEVSGIGQDYDPAEERSSSDVKELITDSADKDPEERSGKKKWLLVSLALALIIAVIGIYRYLQFLNNDNNLTVKNDVKLKSDNTIIIERDFSIPVSYPYKIQVASADSLFPEPAISTGKNQEDPEIKEEKAPEASGNTRPAGTAVNMGNNIYRYGDSYYVQVASFKSNSIAENEAGKFRNKGLASFVESTEIPGRGTWYRIRVGNFSSLGEAKNFIEQNNR